MSLSMSPWAWLAVAIAAEVVGTSALKATEGFTRLWPSVLVAVSYAVAFYALGMTLKTIPVGIAYAIWCGVGIILIALIGWAVFGQTLDLPALAGMALILAGVVVIRGFSRSA